MDFLSKKTFSLISIFILVIYITVLALDFSLHIYGESFTESIGNFSNSYIFYVGYALAAIIAFAGSRKIGIKNTIGKGLFFVGTGMLLNAIGLLIWDYYAYWIDVEVPYPSIADIPWFAMTIFQVIGAFYLVRPFTPRISKGLIAASLLIFIATAGLLTYTIGLPDFSDPEIFTGSLTDFAYTITDAILITLALMTVIIAGGRIFRGLVVYIIALLLMAAGDVIFAFEIMNETYRAGGWSDLSFNAAGIFFCLGLYMIAKTFIEKRQSS